MLKKRFERWHRAVQPVADSASRGVRAIARAEPAVQRGAGAAFRSITKLSGFALKAAGMVVAATGELARSGGDAVGDKGAVGKVAQMLGRATSAATSTVGTVASAAGNGLDKLSATAPHVGAAAGGVVVGPASAIAGTIDHIAVRDQELKALAARLALQGREYARLGEAVRKGIDGASRKEKRSRLLDTLTVGGVSLGAIAAGANVPDEVREAFRLAYPDVAEQYSFEDVVRRLDAAELEGFVSGVKGKLFELQYADWLNDGHLPAGLHAELAHSATQPGWDIAILDAHGHTVDVLQAKATESVSYVKEALERYPHIDIVATDEVQRELALQGLGEHVANGHVSEAHLEALVRGGVDAADGGMTAHFLPSAAGLALIALFAFSDTAKNWAERSRDFGHRAGQGALASATGGAMMALTHTWWLALAGAMGSRYLWGAGNAKRARLARLQALLGANEKDLARLRAVVAREYPLLEAARA